MPGNRAKILSNFSLGAFSNTYFDFLARNTDCKRNCNFSKSDFLSSLIFGETANTASLLSITSTSLSPFLKSVLPLETISQIPSAKPIFGAISTDPLIM